MLKPRQGKATDEGIAPAEAPKALQANARKLALAMSEGDLQSSAIDLAHLYQWKVAHFRSVKVIRKDGSTFWQTPVQADGEGYPDLCMVRKTRIIFAELKREREKPGPAQLEWLHALMLTRRVETFVWRPSDWLSGEIERRLK